MASGSVGPISPKKKNIAQPPSIWLLAPPMQLRRFVAEIREKRLFASARPANPESIQIVFLPSRGPEFRVRNYGAPRAARSACSIEFLRRKGQSIMETGGFPAPRGALGTNGGWNKRPALFGEIGRRSWGLFPRPKSGPRRFSIEGACGPGKPRVRWKKRPGGPAQHRGLFPLPLTLPPGLGRRWPATVLQPLANSACPAPAPPAFLSFGGPPSNRPSFRLFHLRPRLK